MNTNDLAAAIARRDAAQHSLTVATSDRARGETAAAASTAELQRLAAEEDALIGQHAERVTRWVQQKNAGLPPVLAADERRDQALNTARRSTAAAQQALAALTSVEERSRDALAAAEQEIESIRSALVTQARHTTLALITARLRALRDEEFLLCARLQAFAIDAPLPSDADEALNAPPPRPTHETFAGGFVLADIDSPRGGHPAALAAAAAFWRDIEAEAEALAPSPAHEHAA